MDSENCVGFSAFFKIVCRSHRHLHNQNQIQNLPMSNSNAFDLLAEERKNKKNDKVDSNSTKDSDKNAETVLITNSPAETEEAAWTVQSSKTKKATPTASTPKQDFHDGARTKFPTEGTKKKGFQMNSCNLLVLLCQS